MPGGTFNNNNNNKNRDAGGRSLQAKLGAKLVQLTPKSISR